MTANIITLMFSLVISLSMIRYQRSALDGIYRGITLESFFTLFPDIYKKVFVMFKRKPRTYKVQVSPDPVVRFLYFVGGTFFLAVGMVGIVVRLLPTTPFLLLSAGCYSKSSERCHRWLLNNRLFGSYIKNYMAGNGISLKVKSLILVALWVSISFSAFFVVDMLLIRVLLVVIAVGVTVHILTLPTHTTEKN
ncbi:MAG: YbaN family protein [Thermoplasmata archaeon]